MKTDEVINGTLVKATQPKDGKPYVWPKGVTKIGDSAFSNWHSFNQSFNIPESVTEIGSWAFSNWYSFTQPNSRKAKATNVWLRIDNWVFAGCYSGKLEHLRKRLDSGESTPEREKAWEIISKPFPC